MKKPSVSFVILTWNSEKYIRNCLSSVLGMNSIEKEIFVVENGSVDSSGDILKSYGDRINTIFIEQNIGTTKSRNMAIEKCNKDFEFLCILDSDTVVNEVAFLDMINVLRSDESYGMAGPRMCNMNGMHQISAKRFPTVKIKFFKAFPLKSLHKKGEELEGYSFDHESGVHIVDHVISACWLIKNTAKEKVGMLDENIFYAPEDNDYCLRMWKAGYKVLYTADNGIIHDTQRISKKKLFSRINLLHIKGLIYYFCKHRYWLNAPKFEQNEVTASDETKDA